MYIEYRYISWCSIFPGIYNKNHFISKTNVWPNHFSLWMAFGSSWIPTPKITIVGAQSAYNDLAQNISTKNLRRVSENFFGGTFETLQHQQMLVEIEEETRGRLNINDVVNNLSKNDSYYTKSFISCLSAYNHSPIQTKKPRQKIPNDDAEKALVELMKRADIHFFVRKVNFEKLKRWPQISIKSLPYFSFFHFSYWLINRLKKIRKQRCVINW